MRTSPRRVFSLLIGVSFGVGATVAVTVATDPTENPQGLQQISQAQTPPVTITVVHTGLDIPWDFGFIDQTTFLMTERAGRILVGTSVPGSPLTPLDADLGDLITDQEEQGLLGIAIDPGFATNRTFYTCQTHRGPTGGPDDERVVRWTLAPDNSTAVRVGAPLIKGIPLGEHHQGCRLLVGPDGKLWVTTGDALIATGPQSRASLAGKVLRVGLDGSIPADNPFVGQGGNARYIWTFGHRNVQGIALRPGTGQMWSAEHGPNRDDEVNRLIKGGNYGWNPVFPNNQPGYNPHVPMTDLVRFPKAIPAKWSSGMPTIATSGLAFLNGYWGASRGAAVVAQLKGTGVLVLTLTPDGTVTSVGDIPELNDTYGRIRTVKVVPNGDLYVLTSNGEGADVMLRVRPS